MRKIKCILYIVAILGIFLAFSGNSVVASENITTDVNVEPSLTVIIPSGPLNLNLDPSSTTSGSNNLTITVGTNNATGYKTIMTSQSGNTDLVETTDNTLTIPTLASGSYSSPSDFPANHWGYKKDSGSYIPFAINTTILESDTYANDDTTTLSFATKIDYLQASGTYNTTLVFTTTANPLVQTIDNLTYLQDFAMLSESSKNMVLNSMEIGTSYSLNDSRDEQTYTIAKLADGRVWMITNLNLGATTLTQDLTSENTNLTATVTAATFNGWKTSRSNSYTTGNFITLNGYDATSASAYGTLYNYCALSAGTYCYAEGYGVGDAVYDICPAGWRLPTSGSSGEFQILYNNYNNNTLMRTSIVNGGAAFALAGIAMGSPSQQGSYGGYYSSTYYNGDLMLSLYLTTSTINPSRGNGNGRGDASSARCILK